MTHYQDLQKLYLLPEIDENCVDIDFAYAFICAMANSELQLQQWMPMLFLGEGDFFPSEEVASDFAQTVLVIYQQAIDCFQDNMPLALAVDASTSTNEKAITSFAKGYIQGLMLIDNLQLVAFSENSVAINLQQTCLLLLDKLASIETDDVQKLTLFEQLPHRDEIITLLPNLLTSYGHQCLSVQD